MGDYKLDVSTVIEALQKARKILQKRVLDNHTYLTAFKLELYRKRIEAINDIINTLRYDLICEDYVINDIKITDEFINVERKQHEK